MGDFLFGLVIVVFSALFVSEITHTEYETSTYTVKIHMRADHVTLKTAGDIETALHEWFGEVSVINVTLEPDTTK